MQLAGKAALCSIAPSVSTSRELKQAGGDIPSFVKSLCERGVKPRYVARLVTDLNRKVVRRIYEDLACRELDARESGQARGNHINPQALSKLARGLLKDSLKISSQLKSKLAYHFKFSMIS